MTGPVPAALADLFLRSGLLLLVACAAAGAIGKAGGSAASRHLVWLLCLAALLLLPLFSLALPALPLHILPAETVAATPPPSLHSAAVPAPLPAEPERGATFAWTLYILVAAALAARLLLGRTLLALHWRRASASGPVGARLDQLRARLGIRRRVHLRLRAGPAMPMTWGMVQPRILLPAEAALWPEERRRLVLLHELAHVRRFDSPVRLAAALACAFYWFQPGIWFAMRRLRAEQEHASDDLVLAAGAGAHVYAFSLLQAAGGPAPPAGASLAAAMAGPSELERRLHAIVAPGARRRPSPAFVACAAAAALLSALLAATALPVAASRIAEPSFPRTEAAPVIPASPTASPAQILPARGPADVRAPAATVLPAPAAAPLPLPAALVPAPDPVIMPADPPAKDYAAMSADHGRDLAAHRRLLDSYRVQLKAYDRAVEYLRRRGLLGNSGNAGNEGNEGNWGNEGGPGTPATEPTEPTDPTFPTWPTAVSRPVTPAVPPLPAVPAIPSQGP
jgi:beta-lactamase regulating signal transducer with metallopeptidase domain